MPTLRSSLPAAPPQTGTTPEARWEEAARYSAKLHKERQQHFAKVKGGTASRADFAAYLSRDHESRDDAVGALLQVYERAWVSTVTAFESMPRATPRVTATTIPGRVRQILRYLERLRLWHNKEGGRRRSGELTQAEWDAWRREFYVPRAKAAHHVLNAQRALLAAQV